MQIAIGQLGLAAYIQMKGGVLEKVENKVFYFESDKSAHDWRVEYNNSCCMMHDTLVCELRYHLK